MPPNIKINSSQQNMMMILNQNENINYTKLADLSILKMENKYRIIPSIKMALFKII